MRQRHGARLNFLALFLIELFRVKIRVKTINLVKLDTSFRSNAKIESSYKKLQLFFRNFNIDYIVIAKAVVALIYTSTLGTKYRVASLTLRKRTERYSGAKRFNILLLGVIHNGIAYPLLWEMLEKKGNYHSD